jgi:hypothetical protein
MKLLTAILSVVASLPLFASAGSVQEPGWSNVVLARGEMRQPIEATPIVNRPYRPLHFYGNAVRRAHYRGSPLAARR